MKQIINVLTKGNSTMKTNSILTSVNNSTTYSVNQNGGVVSNAEVTAEAQYEQTISKNSDIFALTGEKQTAGIYSPNDVSKNSTYATTPTLSGSNSFIANRQRQLAQMYGVTLNSNMFPTNPNSTAAGRYFAALTSPKNNPVDSAYVMAQSTPTGCCATSCDMMAKINSNGVATSNGSTSTITNYSTNPPKSYNRVNNASKSAYSPNNSGFNQYTNLTLEELSNLIVSEIDNGRSVQLHTKYKDTSSNEHWVVVTGYSLDTYGRISLTTKNGHKYITGLQGVDPWPSPSSDRPQVTSNLGLSATVQSTGQWLYGNEGEYEVRTFKL